MFFDVREGNILTKPTKIKDAKVLVGYEKEGGSPLFVVLEHNGKVTLTVSGEDKFEEILKLVL
jgi:hypothetical protein